MGRKLAPIFTKYEATTQTSLASTVYDGQPGDPVELHHVVYPRVKFIQPKAGKGKGRKAQSAHVPAPYKKSGAYSQFKVKKVKPTEVNGFFDKFGRFLDQKQKKLTQAKNKIVSQVNSQDPGQKVGLLFDEKSMHVDVVEVVGYQPPVTEQLGSQPLDFQSYIRAPCGFLPTVSGQLQLFVSGSQVDETPLPSTSGTSFQVDSGSRVDETPLPSTSATSSQSDSGSLATSGISSSQVDETPTLGSVSPSVEAVTSIFGLQLTLEEEETVVRVGELAAGIPFARNPNLASSAIPGFPEPAPDSWLSEQPDFQTIRDVELLDPFVQPWDLWGFESDVGRLDRAHPEIFSGDVTEVSNLPSEQFDSEEDQGIGWGLHLGEEFWDIRPLLCDDGSP